MNNGLTSTIEKVSAPDLWPPDRDHILATMDLDAGDLPQEAARALTPIRKLGALADIVRRVQAGDGTFVQPDIAGVALRSSAELMEDIASSLPDPMSEVVSLRAAALLDREAHAAAANRHVAALEQPLVLVCGPLATWRTKSVGYPHSMVASTPLEALDACVRQADDRADALLEHLRALLDRPHLTLSAVPAFFVTRLIACGGEANTSPKHFAYFLPEDEGVKRAPVKKTLVFANAIAGNLRHCSLPLAEAVLEGGTAGLGDDATIRGHLLWFRGHDTGHSLLLPETSYKRLRELGYERSIVLQEAIADVIGYLACVTGPWPLLAFSLRPELATRLYMAEMLRYLRRGPQWFPDSEAALIQLSHLLDSGSIEERGGRLVWDEGRLLDGVVRLAAQLVDVVLGGDLDLGRCVLDRHGWRPDRPLSRWVGRLSSLHPEVPSGFAYRQPVPVSA